MTTLPSSMLCCSLLALVIAPWPAAAQTVAHVESAGLPVAGAEVAVWDTQGRLATTRTDILGNARLILSRATVGDALLLVRRLGFAPVQTAFEQRDTLRFTLAPVPVELPVLATNVSSLRCARGAWPFRAKRSAEPSDAEADSLLRAAAERYAMGVSQLQTSVRISSATETISRDERGYGEALPHHDGGSWVRFGDFIPPPYAEWYRHIDFAGEGWRWRFASLASVAAEHFVSDAFRQSHRLVMLGTSAGATVIGFCARDLASPEIEGEIRIAADASLQSARWFYRLPHDDVDAGGETTFMTVPFEGRPYLLGVRGSSWVRSTPTMYTQRRFEIAEWRLSHRTQRPVNR